MVIRLLKTLPPASEAAHCSTFPQIGRPRNFCVDFSGGGFDPSDPSEYEPVADPLVLVGCHGRHYRLSTATFIGVTQSATASLAIVSIKHRTKLSNGPRKFDPACCRLAIPLIDITEHRCNVIE